MNSLDACRPLKRGEVLNADHPEWPLFALTIHGSTRVRIKLAKRLVCALKHLPLRLTIDYETDTERSMALGIGTDPTLTLNGRILAEGLVSAEELEARFQALRVEG